MTPKILSILVIVFVASAGLVGDLFHHARERRWLVVPGKRSSHSAPTPSGAGIVIVLMTLVTVGALRGLGMIADELVIPLVFGGGVIAAVSWLDDLRGVPARIRLAAQFFGALTVLWWIGPLESLDFGSFMFPLGPILGPILTVAGIMWMANLVNFMDGTDGLVGMQTVFVSVVMGALMFTTGLTGPALLLFVLAAATLGFLAWNWHPAKMFLGDVGACLSGLYLPRLPRGRSELKPSRFFSGRSCSHHSLLTQRFLQQDDS